MDNDTKEFALWLVFSGIAAVLAGLGLWKAFATYAFAWWLLTKIGGSER